MANEKKPIFFLESLKEVRLGQGNVTTHQQYVQIVCFKKEITKSIINTNSLPKILPRTTDTPRCVEKDEAGKKVHLLRLTQQEYHEIREQFDPVLPPYETLKFQLRAIKNILAK